MISCFRAGWQHFGRLKALSSKLFINSILLSFWESISGHLDTL